MGRIAELRKKQADEGLSKSEEKELKELLAEADEASKSSKKEEAEEEEEEADEEVEKLSNKLVKSIQDANEASRKETDEKLDKVLKALEDGGGEIKDKNVSKVIVDPKLGRKTVEELSEIKVAIPQRKAIGKSITEVTARTTLFLKALLQADKEKLQLLTEGTAADGGYLVPEEFANMIVEDRRDATVMRQVADQITVNSDTFHLPNLDTRPQASWRGETVSKSTSTVQFGENVFTPYSLANIVGLSTELQADASLGVGGSIVNYIAGLMARALAEKEDQAFWVGDGSGKPTGIDNYTLPVLAASGGTDASKADAIQKTYRRLPQGYRNAAVWVANSLTWEVVDTLKDDNGNYLLRSIADSPTPVLKGRPVFEQNDLPVGKLFFGDFSFYKVVDREGISVRISDEATVASRSAFEDNLVFIRVEQRVDGELTLTQAIRELTWT